MEFLILFVLDGTRPKLTLFAVLAGGTPPWQINSHGFCREEFRGLKVLAFLSHKHQGTLVAFLFLAQWRPSPASIPGHHPSRAELGFEQGHASCPSDFHRELAQIILPNKQADPTRCPFRSSFGYLRERLSQDPQINRI
jgi:hypothetical protein